MDQEWLASDVTAKYPFLRSGWIAEIFCRLAYLEGPVPGYRLPTAEPGPDLPDFWVSATASLPEKLWPLEKWLAVLQHLKGQGRRIGLLGAKPSNQAQFWKGGDLESQLVEAGVEDHRGAFTLPQVVGAIAQAMGVLTLDNGIMHLASATHTPVVALFREGIHRLWAPPNPHLAVVHPQAGSPVSDITVDQVVGAL